jgi:hypothetical protein
MILTALVIADKPNEFRTGKGEMRKEQRLVLLDQQPDGGPAMEQTVEYTMTPEEKDKYAGKLKGKTLTVGVTGFQVFGSKSRVQGSILTVK